MFFLVGRHKEAINHHLCGSGQRMQFQQINEGPRHVRGIQQERLGEPRPFPHGTRNCPMCLCDVTFGCFLSQLQCDGSSGYHFLIASHPLFACRYWHWCGTSSPDITIAPPYFGATQVYTAEMVPTICFQFAKVVTKHNLEAAESCAIPICDGDFLVAACRPMPIKKGPVGTRPFLYLYATVGVGNEDKRR